MLLFFWFDLSLEARAEISDIFSLLFWDKQLFHKDILKLSDLYPLINLQGKNLFIDFGRNDDLIIHSEFNWPLLDIDSQFKVNIN